ncbi:unnamed protein product, partial [Ectocarpus sp. 13 AM-2016]
GEAGYQEISCVLSRSTYIPLLCFAYIMVVVNGAQPTTGRGSSRCCATRDDHTRNPYLHRRKGPMHFAEETIATTRRTSEQGDNDFPKICSNATSVTSFIAHSLLLPIAELL